jgi:hypothetical protein
MEKQFECKTCNFSALLKTNYERHLKTSKHILKCQVNGELPIVISEPIVISKPKVFNELDIEAIKNELKQDYDTKLQAIKNDFDYKLAMMKVEIMQLLLVNKLQAPPAPTAPPLAGPVGIPVQYSQELPQITQFQKQKVVATTYVKKGMKNALYIEKYMDEEENRWRYKNGRDVFNIKELITSEDVKIFMTGHYQEGLTGIINRYINQCGGKTKMPIVCVDKHRKRFLFHIKIDDKTEWVEDIDMKLINMFISGIIGFLSFIYASENVKDSSDMTAITGLIDENQPNYCKKRLIIICEELFCIANLVEDHNSGFDKSEHSD